MKRVITVIIVALSLLSFSTYEAIIVAKTNKEMDNKVNALYEKFEGNKNNISKLENDVVLIENYWHNKEHQLYMIFNHKDLSNLSDSITKLHATVKNNDYDNAIIEISLIKEYIHKNKHNLQFTIQHLL